MCVSARARCHGWAILAVRLLPCWRGCAPAFILGQGRLAALHLRVTFVGTMEGRCCVELVSERRELLVYLRQFGSPRA